MFLKLNIFHLVIYFRLQLEISQALCGELFGNPSLLLNAAFIGRMVTHLNAIILAKAGFDTGEQQNLDDTLTLFNSRAKVLFHTGASNLFITIRVVQELGFKP